MNNYSLQMPDILEVAEDSENFGTFILQPLERGFGVTIGNSFRRVLLSSLRGLAITAVRINGVEHEYSSIDGVKEDVYEIILNLKQVRFKQVEQSGGVINLTKEGPGDLTAGDISEATADFEILNPDLVIATLSDGVTLEMELRVGRGRGYIPAEEQRIANLLKTSIEDLNLSVRAYNCLKSANINTIAELVSRDEQDLLKFRNFGKKSLSELVEVIEEKNLEFGMDVSKYIDK